MSEEATKSEKVERPESIQDGDWGYACIVQTRCPHCGGVTGLEHRYISKDTWGVTQLEASRLNGSPKP